MQHEDDLRGLAKVMQFMRAISVLLLVVHIYWFCYRWMESLGWTHPVVDRVLAGFQRTSGLFGSPLYTKLFCLLLLGGFDGQRQHLHGGCGLGHHGIEPGVAKLYGVKLALAVPFGDLTRQLEALSHRYIGGQQHFLREQFGFVVGKVLCRALADGQHQHLALFGCGLLEHVGQVDAAGL